MSYTIHVRTTGGTRFSVTVEGGKAATVDDLKAALVDKSGIPVELQRLVHRGRILPNTGTLEGLGESRHCPSTRRQLANSTSPDVRRTEAE